MTDSTETSKTTPSPWIEKLLSAVQAIDRPGTFCCGGRAQSAPTPGLEVDRVGLIGLPLSVDQAERLKGSCQMAPHGKGTLTVIDTDVRRVWRLTPERFKLTNPDWHARVRDIAAAAQRELGLEGQRLEPHLYDLLLYEEGGFFLPHRDGEKLDRMVATLVITLPSRYSGGELVVRHQGETHTFDFAKDNPQFNTQYAAFYADCEHEIKPVTGGYRLSLVYNLTLAKEAERPISAPSNRRNVETLAAILHEAKETGAAAGEAPIKLAYTLEHKYSESGLAWNALKGIDKARGRVLEQAAAAAGWRVHLALLTLWESGYVDEDYDDRPRRRSGRYIDEKAAKKAGDEDNGEGPGKYVMAEVNESALTANHWRHPDGESPPFGPLTIDERDIVPAGLLRKMKPKEEYEGYTGNEGMTLDRWYHRAAIVLWPESSHFAMLCAGGARQATGMLEHMVAAAERAPGDAATAARNDCHRLAAAILRDWSATGRGWNDDPAADPEVKNPEGKLLEALDVVDDPKLIHSYLRKVVRNDVIDPGTRLVKILDRRGWETFRDGLVVVFEHTVNKTLGRNARLFNRLCQAADKRAADGAAEARDICRTLAEPLLAGLIKTDGQRKLDQYEDGYVKPRIVLGALATALLAIDADDSLSRLVDHVLAHPRRQSLRNTQMPALMETNKWVKAHPAHARSAALSRWVEKCREQFEALVAAEPQPPTDFAREAKVKCKCRDCAELNVFLASPTERQHDFRMTKDRRDHLKLNINYYSCDLSCTTVATSSPHILRCVKTAASHEARVKEFQENKAHLAALRAMG